MTRSLLAMADWLTCLGVTSALTAPILQALSISSIPVAMVVPATQLPGLQAGLLTTRSTAM